MTSMMGLLAVTWQNCLRKKLPLKTRFLHTLKEGQWSQILMSPPLVSVDLLDIWTPKSSCFSVSSIHKSFNEQTAVVLDGKMISMEIKSSIAGEVMRMKKYIGKVPGLAVIVVGQRRDSQIYVHNKIKACEEAGIKSFVTELPTDCTEAEVQNALLRFNKDPSIHGILVQLPLPQAETVSGQQESCCTRTILVLGFLSDLSAPISQASYGSASVIITITDSMAITICNGPPM